MAPVQAAVHLKLNPALKAHVCMYPAIGALRRSNVTMSRFLSIYIHDIDYPASNQRNFYG